MYVSIAQFTRDYWCASELELRLDRQGWLWYQTPFFILSVVYFWSALTLGCTPSLALPSDAAVIQSSPTQPSLFGNLKRAAIALIQVPHEVEFSSSAHQPTGRSSVAASCQGRCISPSMMFRDDQYMRSPCGGNGYLACGRQRRSGLPVQNPNGQLGLGWLWGDLALGRGPMVR